MKKSNEIKKATAHTELFPALMPKFTQSSFFGSDSEPELEDSSMTNCEEYVSESPQMDVSEINTPKPSSELTSPQDIMSDYNSSAEDFNENSPVISDAGDDNPLCNELVTSSNNIDHSSDTEQPDPADVSNKCLDYIKDNVPKIKYFFEECDNVADIPLPDSTLPVEDEEKPSSSSRFVNLSVAWVFFPH